MLHVAPNSSRRKLRIGFDARMVYYRQAGIGQYILNLLAEFNTMQSDLNDLELVVLQSRKEKRTPAEWLAHSSTHQPTSSAQNAGLFKQHKLWTPPHHRFEQFVLPVETGLANLDLLHSPDFVPPLIRPRLYPGKFGHFAAVITIHDLAFIKFPYLLTSESRRYYGQVQRAARSAEAIIAVSRATARDIEIELGIDPNKIKVVYEAANPVFQPLEPTELNQLGATLPGLMSKLRLAGLEQVENPVTRNFILFVSTIEPRKNLPTLLKAYRRMLDNLAGVADGSDAQPVLVLAGREGWLFEDVYKLASELNLKPNRDIVWLGGVSTDELLWLYNKAVYLVLPSLYEGFGLPPLEALACGTPVLVANTSSLPEVVGTLGTLIAPEDVEAWTEAMVSAWQDRNLRQLHIREQGPEWASRFSWKRAAEETLEVYRNTL